MSVVGINFRATAGFVTDGAGETYSLGEAYPVTRGGQTFGFDANITADARDRGGTSVNKLAGKVAAPSRTFRWDLPSTGSHTPSSHSITVPPPYWPFGIVPSKSA